MKPKRIQRKRTKGWRMPAGCANVTRTGYLGNPFIGHEAVGAFRVFSKLIAQGYTVAHALLLTYDHMGFVPVSLSMIGTLGRKGYEERFQRELNAIRGKNLACFCALDKPCHADVLLELANARIEQ